MSQTRSLADFYLLQFQMHRYHHYSLEEQNLMIPFEWDTHILFVLQTLEAERLRTEKQR